MKFPLSRQFTILATTIFSLFFVNPSVKASIFEQQAVDQSQFVAIARPYGDNNYDLLIIQQIPGQRQCWSESGSNPTLIEPLLLDFDFTGSCERSTDSNGYSIRIDGQDYGLDYLLRIVEQNGELILVSTHRTDLSAPEMVIGRTYGISNGFLKIHLESGWQFTKRSYQGRVLGHVYLTGDSQAIATMPKNTTTNRNLSASTPESPSTPESSSQEVTSSETDTEIKEYTFTAPSINSASPNSWQSPTTQSEINFNSSNSVSEDNSAKNNNNFNSTPAPGELPPPPTINSVPPTIPNNDNFNQIQEPEQLASAPTLNPITPPDNNNSQIVPPPPLDSNSQRRTLSDVLGNLNNPNPSPVAQNSLSGTYKVLVEARNSSQQQQVRSLYPDAFSTSHNGRSMLQVGVFSSQETAENVSQSLKNMGLNPTVIPF